MLDFQVNRPRPGISLPHPRPLYNYGDAVSLAYPTTDDVLGWLSRMDGGSHRIVPCTSHIVTNIHEHTGLYFY